MVEEPFVSYEYHFWANYGRILKIINFWLIFGQFPLIKPPNQYPMLQSVNFWDNTLIFGMEHLDSHLRSFWKWGRRILTARTTSPPDHVDYVFSLPKFFLAQFFTHLTEHISLLTTLRCWNCYEPVCGVVTLGLVPLLPHCLCLTFDNFFTFCSLGPIC